MAQHDCSIVDMAVKPQLRQTKLNAVMYVQSIKGSEILALVNQRALAGLDGSDGCMSDW